MRMLLLPAKFNRKEETISRTYHLVQQTKNWRIKSYQYRVIARSDVQIDRPDADGDHDVYHEPEPVIPEVPRHVDEGPLCQDRALHQEARLAPARVENRPFLQSTVCQTTRITNPIGKASW